MEMVLKILTGLVPVAVLWLAGWAIWRAGLDELLLTAFLVCIAGGFLGAIMWNIGEFIWVLLGWA